MFSTELYALLRAVVDEDVVPGKPCAECFYDGCNKHQRNDGQRWPQHSPMFYKHHSDGSEEADVVECVTSRCESV
ncbi:unnamed protein product [Gongylonema pulchrum]|uniref:Uncharacterized protein n=1 Tax=Gongylonema pulchrum TaxID=637853 RepID=A0A183EU58_9BILA|nr:unnamed protein product [Gongylonema pulchrum]